MERLSEARRLSRAKWSATIERLLSDYRRANPAPKFFQTFQKLFKNPIRIFSKPFEKSSGFSAPRVRGCRGRTVSVRDGSAGLETAGSPPGRARSAAGGDPRDAADTGGRSGSGPGASRAAQGLDGALRVIRGQRSGARRGCGSGSPAGCRCCRAAAAVNRCNAAVGRARARYGVLMVRDMYLYPLV